MVDFKPFCGLFLFGMEDSSTHPEKFGIGPILVAKTEDFQSSSFQSSISVSSVIGSALFVMKVPKKFTIG